MKFFSSLLFLLITFHYPHLHAVSATSEGEDYVTHNLLVHTVDDVTIHGILYDGGNDDLIIYCHRLIGSQSGKELGPLLKAFIGEYDLITFNFRGHKSSGGKSTTGGDEILDLRAVISLATKEGYGKIAVLGAGMGGNVAIRAAAIFRNIDALVVVSPSGLSPELQPFLVKVASDITLDTDYGKVSLRILTNTRLGPRYKAGYPLDFLTSVSSIPVLILQAQDDRFVDVKQLRSSLKDALEPGNLIIVPGGEHADNLLKEDNLARVRDWLQSAFAEKEFSDSQTTVKSSVLALPELVPFILTGDLPLPTDVLLNDLYLRVPALVGTSNEREVTTAEILRNLEDVFSFHGYTKTSLTVADSIRPYTVSVSVPKIGFVSIEGNRWITNEYILSLLKINGGYYNAYELDSAIRRLSSEPAVNTVTSNVQERGDGDVDIHLTVIEQRPYRLFLSAKYTDIDQFYGLGFTWNEFNPSGIQLEGKAMVGVFDRDLLTSAKIRRLIGDNIWLDAQFFDIIKSRDDLEYVYTRQEVRELGGEVAARYRMTSTITVNLGVFRKEFKSPEVTLDFPVKRGVAYGNTVKLDVGGKLPFQGAPLFKWKHTFYFQKMGLLDFDDFDFNTYQLNFAGELKLWHRHRSVTTFHYGWLSGNAPPQEHFSLGGMTTLPGYPDDSFVNTHMVRVSQAIYLYASNWVPETSPLAPFRIVFAFNAGTVWGDTDRFEADDLKMDVGLEIDYQEVLRVGIAVAVGPLRTGSRRVYIGWGAHVF